MCAASLLRFASQLLFTPSYCASDLVDGRGYGAALRRILSSHSRVRRRKGEGLDHVSMPIVRASRCNFPRLCHVDSPELAES